jgi:hypothetical protein
LSSRLLYKNVKIVIYGAINLSFVSYGYRVLRRILGPKRDEIIGDLRKTHNEALHDFYSSANIITRRMIKSRRMRWAGHVARMGVNIGGKTKRKETTRKTYM